MPERSKLPPEAAELDLPGASDGAASAAPSCQTPVAPLPACAAGFAATARAWSEVAARASGLVGQTIRVRGAFDVTDLVVPLGIGSLVKAPAVVAGAPPLVLADSGDWGYEYGCKGYGGHLCCDVPAFGQAIVATGQLWAGLSAEWSPWALVDVSLCEERPLSR